LATALLRALASGFAIADLHHAVGHDPDVCLWAVARSHSTADMGREAVIHGSTTGVCFGSRVRFRNGSVAAEPDVQGPC
ncbi:MAG: hypothetical protein E5Y10_23350, partial [Mesorhizobium sp.]